MKFNGSFSRLNFKNKLILVFSLIIISSIISIGFFNNYVTSMIIQEDIKEFSIKNLGAINLNLERYFNQYEQIFFNIATSTEFSNWLSAGKGNKIDTTINYQMIQQHYINPIVSFYPEILTINLLSENGYEDIFYLNSDNLIRDPSLAKNENWAQRAELNKTYIVSGKNYDYIRNNSEVHDLLTIRFARKFQFSSQAVGYIWFDVLMEPVTKILNEMRYADSGEGMILNDTGIIMADTDTSKISEMFDQDFFNTELKDKDSGYILDKGNNKIIVFSTIGKVNWKSVAVIPYSIVARGIARIWAINLLAIVLSIMLAIVLVVIISASLTKRIQEFRMSIKQIKIGDFGKRISIRGNDEISEFAESFNSMLKYLEQYIHDLAESKLLQQEAVLSALQAQINSHFLYNTLEIINSMAYIAGVKDIRTVVVSLSNMLRYTSNYKDTLVTIEDEIEHLKDYLKIMEIQMGDRLHFQIDIEDNIGNVQCLKAIIQPIVENSIKHGLETLDRPGYIKVKVGYCGTHIYIVVSDSGKGFSEEKLNEIRNLLNIINNGNNIREISKVGLANVNYRLKVFYNNDSETGLNVENIWKRRGAEVRIVFPMRRKGVL